MSDWIDARTRWAIVTAYDGVCQYCELAGAREVEHIVPRARGGTDGILNLTLACERCNLKKGALRLPPLYEGILLARAASKAAKVLELSKGRNEDRGETLRERKARMARGTERAQRSPDDVMAMFFGSAWEHDGQSPQEIDLTGSAVVDARDVSLVLLRLSTPPCS